MTREHEAPERAIRKIALVSVLLILAGASARAQDAAADAVRRAVLEFGNAYRAADVEHLRGMLAEEYTHVNGGSGTVLDRDTWLEWMARRRRLLHDGRLRIDRYEVDDLTIRVFGTTAVVTGIVRSQGVQDGAPFHSRVRFTNVWIHLGGQWRRVAFHDSALPEGS